MSDPRIYLTHPIIRDPEYGDQIDAYGALWDIQSDLSLELSAFASYWPPEEGGLGPYGHLKKAYDIAYPQYTKSWHEWTEQRFKAFAARLEPGKNTPLYEHICLSGAASSTKSRDAAYYAVLWWLANARERAVILVSTTEGALKLRIWNYIEQAWREYPQAPGRLLKSPNVKILFDPTDELHGIHGFAIPPGSTKQQIKNIIGIHPKNGLLVIVDEAPDMPLGIEDAETNWKSGQTDFQIMYLGNGDSRFNLHGLMMEPKDGWNSVIPYVHTSWETTKFRGICIYSSALKSPAVLHPENAEYQKFLPTSDYIFNTIADKGENHPTVWRMIHGFPPPDDEQKTVLTPTLCDYHRVESRPEWSGAFKIKLFGLDPAFSTGGDECIGRFADFGEDVNGRFVLDYGGEDYIKTIKLDSTLSEPISYQIKDRVRELCEEAGVPPHQCALDAWGTAIGLGDILQKHWSPSVYRVMSGGAPSTEIVDAGQNMRACDAYDRKITEMWFRFRTYVTHNQICGLDKTSMEQFCMRQWERKERGKIRLQTKEEYKKLFGRAGKASASPDRADCAVILLELAVSLGFPLSAGQLPDRFQPRQDSQQAISSAVLKLIEQSGQQAGISQDAWDNSFESDGMDGDFKGELV